MQKIDKKDTSIIAVLDMYARMPLTVLAKKVGLSRQVVEYRLKRMQSKGIVFGALGIFDSGVVGLKWFRVLLRLKNITLERKKQFIAYLNQHPHLFWLGEVGGNWDLIMNFVCEDTFAFNRIFESLISEKGMFIDYYELLIYIDVYDLNRAYFSNVGGEREFFYHRMQFNQHFVLDAVDKEIVHHLSKNAFLTNVQLGQQLGVAANTVYNRIKRMQQEHFLLGYRLFINPSVLGYQSHLLFLSITHLNLKREKELYAYLKNIKEITFLVKHIGRWRIGMEIETKSLEAFQEIFVAIRSTFSDVITGFESFPLFKDYNINYFPAGCLK